MTDQIEAAPEAPAKPPRRKKQPTAAQQRMKIAEQDLEIRTLKETIVALQRARRITRWQAVKYALGLPQQ